MCVHFTFILSTTVVITPTLYYLTHLICTSGTTRKKKLILDGKLKRQESLMSICHSFAVNCPCCHFCYFQTSISHHQYMNGKGTKRALVELLSKEGRNVAQFVRICRLQLIRRLLWAHALSGSHQKTAHQ